MRYTTFDLKKKKIKFKLLTLYIQYTGVIYYLYGLDNNIISQNDFKNDLLTKKSKIKVGWLTNKILHNLMVVGQNTEKVHSAENLAKNDLYMTSEVKVNL